MSAPVRIASAAWFIDPDPENALPDTDFIGTLQTVPLVEKIAPRLDFPALLRSAYIAEGVMARGVDPQAEFAVSRVPEKVTEGRWLEATGEVVLGRKLARRVDVRVGERLVLDTSALAGPQAKGLRVVGVVRTGVPWVDQGAVLIHLQDARALTGVSSATMLELDVAMGQEATTAREVQRLLPEGLEARGVWDLIGEPIKVDIRGGQVMAVPIGLLLGLLAALAVTSTVLVSVLERTREFGVMSALGLTPRALARMVALESILATTLGWLAGLLLGYALIVYLATHNVIGPTFAGYGESMTSTGISEELYAAVRAIYVLYTAAVIVLAGLLAIWIPGRHVRRLEPVQAMRAG
jgi:ABC-type lipoprotein release transport system permease subunit